MQTRTNEELERVESVKPWDIVAQDAREALVSLGYSPSTSNEIDGMRRESWTALNTNHVVTIAFKGEYPELVNLESATGVVFISARGAMIPVLIPGR